MRNIAMRGLMVAALVGGATAATAATMLVEEQLARQEESLIVQSPIGGQRNARWFDYRTNIGEAQKELTRDLRHASDTEDLRDAWEEYRTELKAERRHYIKEMRERGYRYGTVRVGD
jgi:hypothetical protein